MVPAAAVAANDVPWLSARKNAIGADVNGSPTSHPLTAGPQRRPARLAAPISAGVRTSLRAKVSKRRRRSPRPVHDQAVVTGFRRPHLAGPSEDLTDVRRLAIARERLELLRLRIEAHHRVGAPVREPHLVPIVHVDGIRARTVAGKLPRAPRRGFWIVSADVAGVPLAHP